MQHTLLMAGTELLGIFTIAATAIATSAVAFLSHTGASFAVPAIAGTAAQFIYEASRRSK